MEEADKLLEALAPWLAAAALAWLGTLIVVGWFFLWTVNRQAAVIEGLSKKIMAMHNPFAVQAYHYEQAVQNGAQNRISSDRANDEDIYGERLG